MKIMFFILTLTLTQTLTLICGSQLEVQSLKESVDSCTLSVDYYKKQIHIADSLYKNYLPQYNYDEVKKAVEFFDSIPLSVDLNFLSARAHYYHAVGLTEHGDIVGACDHYFKALEIMEEMMENDKRRKTKSSRLTARSSKESVDCCPLSVDNKEDYEKIRFIALIYTRLGELFISENYCDLAILKYKKALKYVLLLGENRAMAITYKCLGNSYQLYNMPDSALYYYYKSVQTSSELLNRLDVEKCIAQILFDNGEKDSAYVLVKNNLEKINNENIRYSYYTTLGKMYHEDKIYDSAIYYLEKSFNSTVYYTKLTSAIQLSVIYDSLNNYEKQAYYDTFVSKMSVVILNKGIENTQLNTLYVDYCNKKADKERLKSQNNGVIVILSAAVLTFILSIFTFIKFQNKHKRLSSILNDKELIITQIDNEIKLKEKYIIDLEFKQKLTEGKIRKKNNEIRERDELLIKYRRELTELKNKLRRLQSECSDLNNYVQSEICSGILNQIDELSQKNINSSGLIKLKQEQFVLLLKSANICLNNLMDDISSKHPKLKNDDLYYLCLLILGCSDKQISSLFGVTYNTIKVRKRKICSILGINNNKLHNYLTDRI